MKQGLLQKYYSGIMGMNTFFLFHIHKMQQTVFSCKKSHWRRERVWQREEEREEGRKRKGGYEYVEESDWHWDEGWQGHRERMNGVKEEGKVTHSQKARGREVEWWIPSQLWTKSVHGDACFTIQTYLNCYSTTPMTYRLHYLHLLVDICISLNQYIAHTDMSFIWY